MGGSSPPGDSSPTGEFKSAGTLPSGAQPQAMRSQGVGSSPDRKRILLATPAYGGMCCTEYVQFLFHLATTKREFDLRALTMVDCAEVAEARNCLITHFFYAYPTCSHILFIDNDVGFSADLVKEMIALEEEVVGAVYPKRQIDLRKLHGAGDVPFEQAYSRALTFLGTPGAPHPRHPGFCEVESIGAGILLVARSCVEKMLAHEPGLCLPSNFSPFGQRELGGYLTLFEPLVIDKKRLSEDLSFCHRWVSGCGGKIYASVEHRAIHVGKARFEARWSDRG